MEKMNELELELQVTKTEATANSIVVTNDAEYESAAEAVKMVKTAIQNVEDYWEPLRVSSYNAYQSVLKRKKEMVEPLKNAEKIVKSKISGYLQKKEEERRRQEEELKRLARIEAEKKLQEAAEAEQSGDVDGAEIAMMEAEIMEDTATGMVLHTTDKKVKGVSKTKKWEITSIDANKVPIGLLGITLRPVDEKAVMKLIKASGGTVEIPGIEYKESFDVRIRA